MIEEYWNSIKRTFEDEWNDHRHNLLTKGIGLYSLMMLLGDIVKEANTIELTEEYFSKKLRPLKQHINWSSDGMFSNAGGHKGAIEVYATLKRCIIS